MNYQPGIKDPSYKPIHNVDSNIHILYLAIEVNYLKKMKPIANKVIGNIIETTKKTRKSIPL